MKPLEGSGAPAPNEGFNIFFQGICSARNHCNIRAKYAKYGQIFTKRLST